MTRNPAHSTNSDDSWEQLEADLFGVEVGKEHTAAERVASEPALPVPDEPIEAVAKPIEEDDFGDFGDFGAGLVEALPADRPPPRKSAPTRPKAKPAAKAEPAAPVKPPTVEPAAPFSLSDLDEGPTDEELDEVSDDVGEEGETEAEGDDPYWDPLANWNWQEDDQSRKSPSESDQGRDRSRSGGRSGRPERGGAPSRGGRSDRRPSRSAESHATSDDRGMATPRRSSPERERSRPDAAPVEELAAQAPAATPEMSAADEVEHGPASGKSRRQDRRRSRRHSHPTHVEADEPVAEVEHVEESVEDIWPPVDEPLRPAAESLPTRTRLDELEEELAAEGREAEEGAESDESDDRGSRRRRGRRRRPRNERPVSHQQESAADEDIKQLEENVEDEDFGDSVSGQEGTEEADESESERSGRSRRPRRRRRGSRPERTERPAPASRARRDFDDEVDEDDDLVAADADEDLDEEQDREFVEDETPPQQRRHGRSRRSASETPFVRHIEDDDDDSEPEPAVSYEDVPSWEEAISYLLNPSMVEGGNGDRGERPDRGDRGERPDRGERAPRGERSSRPPRRGPRRDS